MTNAARVWFILQYYGARCVILNGGWPALAAASGLPASAAPSDGTFHATAGAGPVGVVDRTTLKQQLDGAAQVFDSRTRAEFTGEDSRNRTRSGHLPGARHLSHADLMEKGIVRPAPVLRGMLEGVGFGPGDHIVTHCEGGGRAALAAAAAVRGGIRRCARLLPQFRGLGARRKLPNRAGLGRHRVAGVRASNPHIARPPPCRQQLVRTRRIVLPPRHE